MTPEQCRAARAWLDWSQSDLAAAAKVSNSTVRDFEAGRRVPIANNLGAMRAVLESAGIGFVFQDDGVDTKACGITYAKPEQGTAH
ncbi:MAG: helix-turn-helix transcriptional regulator [Alphaproteobacteria bacterium]|nr:helix-turn-helix transcriptional regulator [Alphaproteobacteria bacterium]